MTPVFLSLSLVFFALALVSYSEMCTDFKIITTNKHDSAGAANAEHRRPIARLWAAIANGSRGVYTTISANVLVDGQTWPTRFTTNGIWWPKT